MRVTRAAAAAKEAEILASSGKEKINHQLSSPLPSPIPGTKRAARKGPEPHAQVANNELPATTVAKQKGSSNAPSPPVAVTKKRKRAAAPKLEEDSEELPHGLGNVAKPSSNGRSIAEAEDEEYPQKKQVVETSNVKAEGPSTTPKPRKAIAAPSKESTAKNGKKKTNPYGLTPGFSPFPEWPHPTPEECFQVNNLLSTIHGKQERPKEIPRPSKTVAGCGEVPDILDALLRTYLSSATTGRNSSSAIQGLLDMYGERHFGTGKGSVDWDAVRRSETSRVRDAIKSGGLAEVKSKNIKTILDMVYEENQARRDALLKAGLEADKEKASKIEPIGAGNETETEKAAEIAAADEEFVNLNHLLSMETQDCFYHMLRYPGIGVKTVACVTLFRLQRPCFAVDTHVFRLCKWLGWIPEKATRDTTFSHCEVRVPDELKYSLHQLFIHHGKKCPRCRAITGENSEGWDKGCVIDHLVNRTGLRKGSPSSVKKKRAAKGKRVNSVADGDEDVVDEITEENEGSDFEADKPKLKGRKKPKALANSPAKTSVLRSNPPVKAKAKTNKDTEPASRSTASKTKTKSQAQETNIRPKTGQARDGPIKKNTHEAAEEARSRHSDEEDNHLDRDE